MATIKKKSRLNPFVTLLELDAPQIARRARAGQFIMLRLDDRGERIPLTIAGWDAEAGTITIIFQVVGLTTRLLAELNEGDDIADLVGPLGVATHIPEGVRRACVVGGGVGCAIALPQAKALFDAGVTVDVIAGFRNRELVILEDELRACSHNFYLTSDDGSAGRQGFVTGVLEELIAGGAGYDLVIAIGPVPMMKFLCKVTEPHGIPTVVSLNPLMVDGTGMCGCCRVTVGGEVKFACVDGPDFDGHQVDFDELTLRNTRYKEQEAEADKSHECRLQKMGREAAGEVR